MWAYAICPLSREGKMHKNNDDDAPQKNQGRHQFALTWDPTTLSYWRRPRFDVRVCYGMGDSGIARALCDRVSDAWSSALHPSDDPTGRASVLVVLLSDRTEDLPAIEASLHRVCVGPVLRGVVAIRLPGHTRVAVPPTLKRLLATGYAQLRPSPRHSEDVRQWTRLAAMSQFCESRSPTHSVHQTLKESTCPNRSESISSRGELIPGPWHSTRGRMSS